MREAARSKPQNLRRALVDSPLLVAEELIARPELAPQGDIVGSKIVITLGGFPVLYAATAVVTLLGGVLIYKVRSVP